MTIIAILLPPLAMLMIGRPIKALVCVLLMVGMISWPIASIWAVMEVADKNANSRTDRLAKKLKEPS